MTDTMTPPEPAPAAETPGAMPPSVVDAQPIDNAQMAGSDTEGPSDAQEGPSEAPESDEGMPAPPKEGTPVFPGQKLKHTGDEGKIEKIADDYVIPLSDQAIKEWAKTKDEAGFKAYAEQIACGLYPTFAPQIMMGLPTRVLLDPYIQVAQQVLGPIMTEPNWSDPKWGQALQGGMDPKTGRPIPMQLNEWEKFLMTHDAHNWDKTPQAHERANQFVKAMNQGFSQPAQGEM